jgi:DNA-binding NarL/FixJ family response regulator
MSGPREAALGDMTIRLALADDHPLILDGLEALFSSQPDLAVVARCRDGNEAWEAVVRERPDVLVLDVRMPGMGTMELLRAIAQASLPTAVMLYTASLGEAEMLQAVRLGVRGVMLKDMPTRLLVECVHTIHAGKYWLEKNVTGRALETVLRQQAGARRVGDLLTDREIEIACAVATGLRNKAIADKLNISEGTVKVHLHNIYQKLELDGRHALGVYAREHGLIWEGLTSPK